MYFIYQPNSILSYPFYKKLDNQKLEIQEIYHDAVAGTEAMIVVNHEQVDLEYIMIKIGGFWSFIKIISSIFLSYMLYEGYL